MDKAKLDIENKLIPKGAGVTRHLTLPAEGRSSEWIIAEMDKMDRESSAHSDWRNGKLSGGVYRTQFIAFHVHLTVHSIVVAQMAEKTLRQ